jgi:PAS domain S-box-containing protein
MKATTLSETRPGSVSDQAGTGAEPVPNEHRLRALIDQAGELISILNAQGIVVWDSCGEDRPLGYRLGETVGLNALSLIHPDDLPAVARVFENGVREPGRREHLDVRVRAHDGSWRWCRVTGTNLLHDPTVAGVVLNLRDITEERQAQEALRVINAGLEVRVAERTAELSATVEALEKEVRERLRIERNLREGTVQLRTLVLELTRAEERERQRVAQMLDDGLQQLLASARLRADLLRTQIRTKPLAAEADRIVALLRDSINAAKSLTLELSPPVLHGIGLAEALRWLAGWMKETHDLTVEVESTVDLQPDPDGVSVLLFLAARELLFNVVKHAGVKTARLVLQRGERQSVRLIVSDQGRGIDACLVKPQAAAGFGLYSIRERLGLLGGQMIIQGQPGAGTAITLEAPIEEKPPAVSVPPVREAGPGSAPQGSTPPAKLARKSGAIRVLLADDHKILREGLAAMLRRQAGLQVIGEVADGLAAIEAAHRLHPDVVIMDISMPVMNGIEATRRITAECPGVRVIGLSMHDSSERAHTMRSVGAVGFVHKGAPATELVAAIRTHVPAPAPRQRHR